MTGFLNRKIPPFLYRKNNLVILVAFTATFALVFINIYKPFNSETWFPLSQFEYLLYSSLLTMTGVMVVIISRAIMYFYTKRNTITYWNYAVWILAEILSMSLLYTMISYTLKDNSDFWEVLNASAQNTSLILLIPYSVSILFFSWQEKNQLLKEAKERETEKIASTIETDIKLPKEGIITFFDDKGEMKLSIKKESLLYIESADNYVEIWYLGKMGVSNYLLRNTLKAIEEKFDNTNIIRCHRSFIVNCDQVKVAKKGKNGVVLDLGIDKIPEIPVSKNYGDKISSWLMS